jgi:hypothetical protein
MPNVRFRSNNRKKRTLRIAGLYAFHRLTAVRLDLFPRYGIVRGVLKKQAEEMPSAETDFSIAVLLQDE